MKAIGKIFALLILLVLLAGGAAWLFRDELVRWVEREGREAAPAGISPETAERAAEKLDRLREDDEVVRLSEVEIASLIRYRWSGWVPAVLREPAVSLAGDTLRIGGRLPAELLPMVPELERVRDFLPDTVDVEVAGRLGPLAPGRAALDIGEIEVAGLPLPARFYPLVLERLGRRDEPGLPPAAIAFALPDGVSSARVEGGDLVLHP